MTTTQGPKLTKCLIRKSSAIRIPTHQSLTSNPTITTKESIFTKESKAIQSYLARHRSLIQSKETPSKRN